MAKIIMIQGTCSNAGKSLLCAAPVPDFPAGRLPRCAVQVTEHGAQLVHHGGRQGDGRAQVVQAEAAGIAPDVRMNPILLKPTSDVGSQVIIMGEAQGNRTAREYWGRKRRFCPLSRTHLTALPPRTTLL